MYVSYLDSNKNIINKPTKREVNFTFPSSNTILIDAKPLSLANLKAYYLTSINKPVLFTSKPKYHLNSETGELAITHDGKGKAFIRWGVNGWKLPPENIRPEGTEIIDGTAQSPMKNKGNKQTVVIPNAIQINKIDYVLYYPDLKFWDNNGNKDYHINISNEPQETANDSNNKYNISKIIKEITTKEKLKGSEALNWNIATRFDFVSGVLDKAVNSKDILALLACYIDFSINNLPHRNIDPSKGVGLEATRKNALRFGHLASSTEKLASIVLEKFNSDSNNYPEIRNIIKNLRGATGNLGDVGSFIQKESLNIVRDNRWRNLESYKDTEDGRGTYLFQLQRKLHNALNPDDAKIIDAYIDFLKTGGDINVYNRSLKDSGIDTHNYNNYFTNQPIFHKNETNALIDKLTGLKNAIVKFFEGPSLEESLNNLNNDLDIDLKNNLLKFISIKDKTNKPEQVLAKLAEIRPSIKNKLFITDSSNLKNLLALDVKLEEIGNLAVKNLIANICIDKPDQQTINKELLKNVCNILIVLSCNGLDNKVSEEINIVKEELQNQIETCNVNNKDWNLQTKLIFDRIVRILGNHENNITNTYQKHAKELCKILKLDNGIAKEYSEHLLRLESTFDFSKLLQLLRKETRKNAGLPPWDIISRGSTQGKVLVADTLYDIPLSKEQTMPLIAVLNRVTGSEDIPKGIKAIICGEGVDVLSHLGIRARQDDVALIVCDDRNNFEKIKNDYNNKLMKLNCAESDIEFSSITKIEENKGETKNKPIITITPMNVKHHPILVNDYTLDTVGPKSYNLGLLASRLSNVAEIPNSISIPCGMLDDVLNSTENKQLIQKYYDKIKLVDSLQSRKETAPVLQEIKELVMQLKIPVKIQQEIKTFVNKNLNAGPKMIRSSYNGEDLEKYAGAGLYDSYPCFKDSELIDKIKDVWSSKWNDRAYWSRRENHIAHENIQPTVLIQELIPVDHSFVVHTVHPITNNKNEIIIQLAQGLGEAIVSGHYPGQAYTFIYNKKTGTVTRTSFANKSEQLVMTEKGFEKKLANYTNDKYCKSQDLWEDQIINIAKAALEIEAKWGNIPQDIEGGIKDGKTYILQTRNQVFNN